MKLLLLLAFAPIAAIWKGYVLTVLWAWFMVPAFHVAPLRIPFAIGIGLIVGWLTHVNRKPEQEPETAHTVVMSLILPALVLGSGWIVAQFI